VLQLQRYKRFIENSISKLTEEVAADDAAKKQEKEDLLGEKMEMEMALLEKKNEACDISALGLEAANMKLEEHRLLEAYMQRQVAEKRRAAELSAEEADP
jgi:hypothetical protein